MELAQSSMEQALAALDAALRGDSAAFFAAVAAIEAPEELRELAHAARAVAELAATMERIRRR